LRDQETVSGKDLPEISHIQIVDARGDVSSLIDSPIGIMLKLKVFSLKWKSDASRSDDGVIETTEGGITAEQQPEEASETQNSQDGAGDDVGSRRQFSIGTTVVDDNCGGY
jgi:hypothetical protein